MLESLRIANFALITQSSIFFKNGFNVLTGETGAGKSLIVDALLFLTGIRADKTFIKSGEEYSRVEGVFSVDVTHDKINEILSSVGLDNEGTIIISRQFNLSGKNECRINGELVTLNIIRKLSSFIIDIFGQNDSQILLDSANHLSLLDNMFESELSEAKLKLQTLLSSLSDINKSITELGGLDKDRENNIQLLQFQIKEIEEAHLYDGKEEDLKSKILSMQNCEKILSAYDSANQALDGEYSLENVIKTAINFLSPIESYDESVHGLKDRLYNIRYELQDIVSELSSRQNSIVYSEEELDILQDSMSQIKDLERKYGNTIEDVLNTLNELKVRLDKLTNADVELERLRLNKSKLLKELYNVSLDLRSIRIKEITCFKDKLENELKLLGMKNAKFEVNFLNDISLDTIERDCDENGADKVEFLFSANLGVEPRPLDKIISGGEMSRFMLAFKSIQNADSTKTCIFDEIDTGIGGEIGFVVGKKIADIASATQVICITHLAQISCFGDANFKIEKYDEDNKTITSVRLLNDNEKTDEIARMLSGVINETSIKHASEIIDSANGYKNFVSSK